MSNAWVSEYDSLAVDSKGNVLPAGQEPAIATQTFSFTATAGVSAAFSGTTKFVRVVTDAAGKFRFSGPGLTPTAVTGTDPIIAANAPEYFGVHPNAKVSLVT